MKRVGMIAGAAVLSLLSVAVLGGCSKGGQGTIAGDLAVGTEVGTGAQPGGISGDGSFGIVCSNYPQYDFVNQILGDNPAGFDVTYLLGSGVDMHSYQASAEDMIKIRTSDLFLYVGGESDQWVNDILKQTGESELRAIALMDMVETKDEVIVEGMEHDHDGEDHDHEVEDQDHEAEDHDHDGEDHDHEAEDHTHESGDHDHDAEDAAAESDSFAGSGDIVHEGTPDEHVWLSLRNAEVIVNAISDEICAIDPQHADGYREHAAAYIARLQELDGRYEEAVKAGNRQTILVADRFPFRYLADDYGLRYYAAFPGCSAETEASFETVIFLAEKIGENQLPVVLTIDGSDGKIAQTVIANSPDKNARILTLNSVQSVSKADIEAGVTYLGVMEENLNILKEALK